MTDLAQDNWMKPDPRSQAWVRVDKNGEPRPLEPDDWFRIIHETNLNDQVPEEVSDLLDAARAAITYGYFYYPLYALGLGQLSRVGEAALRHGCILHGVGEPETFHEALRELENAGLLTEDEYERWDALRQYRNRDSHAMSQTILPPGMSIGVLDQLVHHINDLYEGIDTRVEAEE